MGPYDEALEMILKKGKPKSNKRTGIKTLYIGGLQTRYSLEGRFPLLTRRKVWPKAVFAELLWFLSGSTNNEDLKKLGAGFWTPWVDQEFEEKHNFIPGSFGPVYGFQLRHFGGHYGNGSSHSISWNGKTTSWLPYGHGGFDQLQYMLDRIKNDPSDRRILFSLWNPQDIDKMRLPPCHYTYQLIIDDDGRMTGHLTQRSNDYPIGVPANIQFYSVLTMMFAQQTGYTAYEFIHEAVDAHIYENQIAGVEEYLATPVIDSPVLTINKAQDMLSYKPDDFVLDDFQSGPKIEIPVAV
jgi:thymidylate synthase